MKGAGGGRPTKPADQRRNRNPPTHGTVALPRAGREGPAPAPTAELPELAWKVWALLWSSPEASQWSLADVPAVTRMVLLQTSEATMRDARFLAELRNLEDRFCLNPYSRRINRWVLEDDESPSDVDDADVDEEEFAHLRVVG